MLNSHGGHGILPVRMDTPRHTIFTVARHKYAWPGGYAMFAVMADGALMCADCVRENAARIARATRDPSGRTGWEFVGVECAANMDLDGSETCGNCYRVLDSL